MEITIYALKDNRMHYGSFDDFKELIVKKGEKLEARIEKEGVFVKMPDNIYYLMNLECLKECYKSYPERREYDNN